MGKNEVAVNKNDLLLMLSALRCETVHHAKADRHEFGTSCPVVQRLMEKYIGKA